jgi:hypothetical protein
MASEKTAHHQRGPSATDLPIPFLQWLKESNYKGYNPAGPDYMGENSKWPDHNNIVIEDTESGRFGTYRLGLFESKGRFQMQIGQAGQRTNKTVVGLQQKIVGEPKGDNLIRWIVAVNDGNKNTIEAVNVDAVADMFEYPQGSAVYTMLAEMGDVSGPSPPHHPIGIERRD